MPTEYLKDEHHLLRHVKRRLLRLDESDNVLGFLAQAFNLKPGEAYLSASWVEYFEAEPAHQVAAAAAHFATIYDVKKKDRFALGNVGNIKAACAEMGAPVRVTREPLNGYEAHSGVRQFRDDNDDLLELLAAEAWATVVQPA